jgi:malate dehydrogenase (oxaloacetate-decarboxylating)(NADP+)
MAMLSYSNFGSDKTGSPASVHQVVKTLHTKYPDMVVDGEMQVTYALNKTLRDEKFPFSKLAGKDVNTLIFPNLSSANTAYKMLMEMGLAQTIGPIQMGLNKPIHIMEMESSVSDIVNMTAVAVLDAIVEEQKSISKDSSLSS